MSDNSSNFNLNGILFFICVVFFILAAIYLFFYYTTKIGIFLWNSTRNIWITSTWLLLNYGYFGIFYYFNEYAVPKVNYFVFPGFEYYIALVVAHLAYSIYHIHKNPEYFYYECSVQHEQQNRIPMLLKLIGFGILVKLGYDAGRKIGKS